MQLPVLSVLSDAVSHRRDVFVVASGIISTVSIAILAGALSRCNWIYESISAATTTTTSQAAGVAPKFFPTMCRRLVLGAGISIWGVIGGKVGSPVTPPVGRQHGLTFFRGAQATMRYFVDASGLADESPHDERFVVETALLIYTLFPLLFGAPGGALVVRKGTRSTSMLFAERGLHIAIVGAFLAILR